MKQISILLLLSVVIMLVGCQQEDKQVVTKKIQYDVNIKSPSPDYDWWIQNLVGPEREKLVNIIIDGAKAGKWQAYDYFNEPINKIEVANIFSDTTVVTMMREVPPYKVFDTIIINNILKEDVLRLRFLEEWKMDPENLNFEKKVLGIAPIARRFDFNGIERWQPLFWIYTDEDFIAELKNSK